MAKLGGMELFGKKKSEWILAHFNKNFILSDAFH